MDELITLDYGSGGKKTSRLIEGTILPALSNPFLGELGDGAILPGAPELVFSTDSFVIDPIFFPGGDIGKLAVCGTVNDLAVCGAEPKYLSLALILEEGFPLADLEHINTACIGFLKYPGLSPRKIREGDAVLVSGTVGDHGTAVMLSRSGLMQGALRSDCAALNGLCEAILRSGAAVRVLRDPTRGGVATTLNEFVEGTPLGIELDEAAVPVLGSVTAACELLGLDPLYCANEGKLLAVVAAEDAETVLEAMRSVPEGHDAARIGTVTGDCPGKLVARTALGGRRVLQKLTGAQLPRIC